jgi:hypothetical protein
MQCIALGLMCGMDGIDEHHRLIRSYGVEKFLVACDEGLLPDIVEAAGQRRCNSAISPGRL